MSICKPLVSICCLCYNHEPYIKQCLDGFIMQKCNFSFEVLIHDDASLDGSATIIREYEKKYPDIIKPIYQKVNQYSQGVKVSETFNESRAQGKYIALCEGDDYWIDPYKLQKQVDILESDKSIGLVYTDYYQLINSTKELKMGTSAPINSFVELILDNKVATLTTCFRKSILEEYISNASGHLVNLSLGDYPTWLYFALKSKLFYLSETTCVYRVLEESASHSKDISKCLSFAEDVYKVRMFYIERYISDPLEKESLLLHVKSLYYYARLSRSLSLNAYKSFKRDYAKLPLVKVINKSRYYLFSLGYTKVGWMFLQWLIWIRTKFG